MGVGYSIRQIRHIERACLTARPAGTSLRRTSATSRKDGHATDTTNARYRIARGA